MRSMNDETLVICYLESLELQLDEDFIELLTAELNSRNIQIPSQTTRSTNRMSRNMLQTTF